MTHRRTRSRRPVRTQAPRRLDGARDAGVTVRSRRRMRRQRSPYPAMTAIVTVIGLALLGWTLAWGGAGRSTESELNASGTPPVAEVSKPEREPTPLIAKQGDTEFHLAVDPAQLTGVAFHQASGKLALGMTSLAPDADMTLAAELRATPPVDPGGTGGGEAWAGSVLRLWRSNRTGEPDTAMDVGADPGTPVWAPVTGTVVQVRPYLLYDKHEDFEIHIKPDGREDADVVLIHVQDVLVQAGDRVFGGATQLASVRKMSDKIEIQLAGYTENGGDHAHIQINRIPVPGELAPPGDS